MSTSYQYGSRFEDESSNPSEKDQLDDTIEARISNLIGQALGSDFEDNFSFNDNGEEEEEENILFDQDKPRTKITVNEKLRKTRVNPTRQSNKNKFENHEFTGETFQIGDVVINESKARLCGLSMDDLKKRFEKKDDKEILPEPKSLHFANLQKNKNFRRVKREDIFSKEDERQNCTFKPKAKTAAQIAAAKAAGFNIGGNNSDQAGAGSGGFRMKEETEKDREVEKEKAFCRRQDAFINAKRKDLERNIAESNYDYVLDCDKKRCPCCGNLQSYEEILKKEKKCRGETCNGAAYVRGVTFDAKSFLGRQRDHQEKSEAQMEKIKASLLEEDVKLAQKFRENLNTNTTMPIAKSASNSSATAATKATLAADPSHNVPKDLKQPRYLSKTMTNGGTGGGNSRVLKETKGANNTNASHNIGRVSGGHVYSTTAGRGQDNRYYKSMNEAECDQQMLSHLEAMVGGKDGKQAHKFVTDTYQKMMQSEGIKKNNKTSEQKETDKSESRSGNMARNMHKTHPQTTTSSLHAKTNNSYDHIKHEERRKSKNSLSAGGKKSSSRSTKTSSENPSLPLPLKKKSTSPTSSPPQFTVPTLSRKSSLEQPIGRVKSGPIELDPWASLLY